MAKDLLLWVGIRWLTIYGPLYSPLTSSWAAFEECSSRAQDCRTVIEVTTAGANESIGIARCVSDARVASSVGFTTTGPVLSLVAKVAVGLHLESRKLQGRYPGVFPSG